MRVPSAAARERIVQRLTEIEKAGGDGTLTVARSAQLNVSSLGKIMFPESGSSKGDLMRYYTAVAPFLLPLLADRPLSLKRPNPKRVVTRL